MKKFSSTTRVSSRRTSHKKKVRKLLYTGLFLTVLVFLMPRLFGFGAALVVVPVLYFENTLASIGSFLPDFFQDRVQLIKENEKLERQLATETISDQTIKRLLQENRSLRRLLGDSEEKRTGASIIGRPAVTPYDVIIIDKGSVDGIQKNAPVYLGEDQAIGYVAEVYGSVSVVTLLSTPGFEASVYIYGPNIYTTARGIGGGVLEVSVPQGILLSEGDLVVVPALGAGVYGAISVVRSVASEPEQKGYVTYRMPLQSMQYVSVGESVVNSISFEEAAAVVAEVKKDLATVPVPAGVLVETKENTASSTATSTAELITTE